MTPKVEHDGLACRPEDITVRDGEPTTGTAVVLSKRKIGTVRIKKLDGLRVVLRQFDLHLNRIRFQEDQPVRFAMFGQRHGPAMKVNDPLGRFVKARELPRTHAVATSVGVQGVERPAILQVESTQHAVEECRDLV